MPHDFFKHRDQQGHETSTESILVRRLVSKFGASGAAVLRQARTAINSLPTLAWFCASYPTFPVFLGYRKVRWQHKVLPELRKRFTRTPCYKAWEEILDTRPDVDERRVACVFRWPKLGACVISEVDHAQTPILNEFTILKSVGRSDKRFTLFAIEPLNQFIERLEWTWPAHLPGSSL